MTHIRKYVRQIAIVLCLPFFLFVGLLGLLCYLLNDMVNFIKMWRMRINECYASGNN